jgi:hypothetical protein
MDYNTICETNYQNDYDFGDKAFMEFEYQAIDMVHSFQHKIQDKSGALPFNENDFEFVAYCVSSIKDLAKRYEYKDCEFDFSDRVWDTINKGLNT